jgi:FixJ family two-component response regulator
VGLRDATVFVVDDDSAMRDSLRWLLESVGLRVETFATGEEFLDTCDPSRSGCVLLDVHMPGMDGLTVERHLHERDIALPVIILTAYADGATAARASTLGALAFLKKPCDDQILLDTVEHALAVDRDRRA